MGEKKDFQNVPLKPCSTPLTLKTHLFISGHPTSKLRVLRKNEQRYHYLHLKDYNHWVASSGVYWGNVLYLF